MFSKIFKTKWAVISIGLILFQQMLVASSNFWLKGLSGAVASRQSINGFLCLYIGSLILPYLPGALGLFSITRWSESLIKKINFDFVRDYKGRTDLWPQTTFKNEKIPHLSFEAPQSIRDFCVFCGDFTMVFFNVTLNIVALSLIIEMSYLYSFALSCIVVGFLLIKQAKKQSALAELSQESRVQLNEHQKSAWDNVTLNNSMHFYGWFEELKKRLNKHEESHVRVDGFRQIVSIVVSFLTFIPTLAVAVYSIVMHQNDLTRVLAIVVTLPRLFMIMANLHSVLSMLASYPGQISRLKGVFLALDEAPEEDLRSRYTENKLKFYDLQGQALTLGEFEEKLSTEKPTGRFTLRGPNGAGKSSYLLGLKNRMQESACYLPAQHELFLMDRCSGSTGENTIQQMQRILNDVPNQVLIFDEWDANLDDEHTARLDKKIDEIAAERCVIEVRH